MSQPIKYSELWDRLEPFAQTLIDRLMLQGKSGKGSLNEPYAIILYDSSAQALRFYSFTIDGLNAAKAAAEVGDIIFLPAGTIVLSGGTGYTYGDEISTGPITVTDDTGHEISGLTIGNWYAIESLNGYWDPGPTYTQTNSTFSLSNGGGFSGVVGLSQNVEVVSLPSFCEHGEVFVGGDGKTYGRVYFQATTTSVFVRVADSKFTDNTGTLSWRLRSAVAGIGVLEVNSGIEIVGLGENSVLEGSIINNGILTNLKVTGTISGSGSSRMVSNPLEQLFSRIIKSSVQPGNPPFMVESDTLVNNLNADLLDGLHADEIVGSGGVEIDFSESNVSNPPTEVELITAFGSPDADAGRIAHIINDYRGDSNVYLAAAVNGHWWITTLARTVVAVPTFTVSATKTIASVAGQWFGRASVRIVNGIVVLAYYESSTHYVNDGELHIRFSDDYGATWSAEDTTLTGAPVTGFPMNPPDAGAGEDAGEPQLYIAPNGDLLIHMWRVDYGVTANGSYQARSTDGGLTWSTPAAIAFGGTIQDLLIFSTDDEFTYNDIIYAGAREYDDATPTNSKNIFIKSIDNGVTWDKVSDISSFTVDTIEVGLEYLGNSTILAILRDKNNTYTYKTTSTDMGATWAALTDITASFQASGRIRVKTRSHWRKQENWWNDEVLIACGFQIINPGSSMPRRNAIWISLDRGASWDGPKYCAAQTEDAGYGDLFWNPVAGQWVFISYQGAMVEATLEQYNLTIGGI